eukprot:GILI01003534.1.p1 GENE.GILI01003534.1~~GILI01003534.1.p1  ORF type:complete len:561 (+),score=196.93 GILI01003534.1:110-1792(+)
MRLTHVLVGCILFLGISHLAIADLSHRHRFYLEEDTHAAFTEDRAFAGFMAAAPSNAISIETDFYDQDLDHFDASETRTYKQRFHVNRAYFDKDNGPVFLYIGGEGPLPNSSIAAGFIVEAAQRSKALIVSLEHRYYGASVPSFVQYTQQDLKFLSSMQALEDVATFYSWFIQREKLDAKAHRWVAFGGSYPGSLSAWARLKYPQIFVASLASSAPVNAKLAFFEYDQVVRASLKLFSDECVIAVSSVIKDLDVAIDDSTKARAVMNSFGCDNSVTDPTAFSYVVADAISYVVQYSDSSNPSSFRYKMIDRLCTNITASAKVETLATFVQWLHGKMGTTCAGEDMTQMPGGSQKSWYWQSCTEFGYFQVAPTGSQGAALRSPRINLDWHIALCNKLYNLSVQEIPAMIQATNSRYGGLDIATSRTVFTNGELDPWKALGIVKNLTNNVAYILPQSSHCADLHGTSSIDPAGLTQGRSSTYNFLMSWLQGINADYLHPSGPDDKGKDDNDSWINSPWAVGGIILACLCVAIFAGVAVSKLTMRKKRADTSDLTRGLLDANN